MARNRQQRRDATIYRLEPIIQADARESILATGPEHFIEGEIGDCLIVSVPPTASHETCRQLRDQLREAIGRVDRNILILTHNIEFLRARKLTPAEASKILREVDERVSPETRDELVPTEATA